MKQKPKPCKGTGLALGWGCGKKTLYRTYGLGKMCCYPDWLLNSENGKIVLEKARIKAKKDVEKSNKKKEKQKFKKIKESLKTLSDYKKEARLVFQKWIRERDKNKPCISCSSNTSNLWDGGHYLKAELYSGLIFNEDNVHKQCRKCNRFLGGNELNYRKGLIERYGVKFVEDLESIADENRVKKYTKEELIEIKKKYQTKLKNIT